MKKIAMLGDLHGNLTATLAMEKALKDYHVDEIWFLGDAVGKGPQSRETCDWVRANCTRFVGGNWDYGIGGKRFAAETESAYVIKVFLCGYLRRCVFAHELAEHASAGHGRVD